jgi:predicted amidophosphoribosyltransferase
VIPGTDSAWAATRYEGSPRALVAALKFNRRLALAGVAAEAIAASAPSTLAVTAVVPAPADPWRARLRGFDAADLIARSLGGLLGLPVCHCLGRRHAPRQVGKPRARRLRDAPRVQATMRPPAVPLLVDDVVTTGATLAAATSALRRAGCETVLAAAFARA